MLGRGVLEPYGRRGADSAAVPIATVRSAAATATNAAVTSRGLDVVATTLPSRSYTEPSFWASVTSNEEPPVDSARRARVVRSGGTGTTTWEPFRLIVTVPVSVPSAIV